MKVIGVTGGIGAGKSTVLDILEKDYGAYIIKADDVAKELMTKGHKPYNDMVEIFGDGILNSDSTINREKLASIIFDSPNKRLVVNSIVHPQVKKWIREKIGYLSVEDKYRYVIVEAALLVEDHYDAICDELWYIYASEEVRRERLKSSRGYTDEKITSVYKNQLSDEAFRKACDHVIDNGNDIEYTKEQIRKIL